MKCSTAAAWSSGLIVFLFLPLTMYSQVVSHAFNTAAAHDAGAAAHLAAGSHLGNDMRVGEHFHPSGEASHFKSPHEVSSDFRSMESHTSTVHVSNVHEPSSDFRALESHSTASREVPKTQEKPEPRVTSPAAKTSSSSGDYRALESHRTSSKPTSSSSQSNEVVAKIEKPPSGEKNQALTNSQNKDLAKYSGMKPVKDPPFDSHGQLVFSKDGKFFTPDVDSHNGGVWKEFSRRGQRVGTLNENLSKIGK